MRVQLNARNRGYEFDVARGERLLYAGLAHGINLPFECGTGTCGTCKARLTSGEIDDLWPQALGRTYLKQPGEFLMCQAALRGDVSVEVASFVYNMDPGACVPQHNRGIVRNRRMLTHDVLSFSVDLERPQDFDAGQFMAIEMPGIAGYRGYSIVNFERRATRLDFVVKKKPGGACSEWLCNGDAEGENVRLFGPLGTATFFPSIAKSVAPKPRSGEGGLLSSLISLPQPRHS